MRTRFTLCFSMLLALALADPALAKHFPQGVEQAIGVGYGPVSPTAPSGPLLFGHLEAGDLAFDAQVQGLGLSQAFGVEGSLLNRWALPRSWAPFGPMAVKLGLQGNMGLGMGVSPLPNGWWLSVPLVLTLDLPRLMPNLAWTAHGSLAPSVLSDLQGAGKPSNLTASSMGITAMWGPWLALVEGQAGPLAGAKLGLGLRF